jgi:hypothetical protein
VDYLDFLRRLHEALEPPTYLEIGIRHGDSLALARCPTIGIDPSFQLKIEPSPEAALFEETSDAYFARPDPLAALEGRPVAMAFVDGMHLAEFALRDFINVERLTTWTSVVVFDDVLPRDADEASRERYTRTWTGDIYKLPGILARERPDLIALRVRTKPTGLLLVLAPDAANRLLSERYEEIEHEIMVPDPRLLPREIAERRGFVDPEAVLGSSVWVLLREARARELPREEGLPRLRRAVRRDFAKVIGGPLRRLLPLPA